MVDYVNNNLAIEAGWLIDQGITSKDNYDAYVKRHKIRVVRRGCRNTPAMIDYESMPDRFKRAVVEKLGRSPYQDVKKSQIEINIEHDAELSRFFDDYSFDSGRRLPKETRLEYYTNAIVLKGIHRMLCDKKALWKAKGKRFVVKWNEVSEGCQELDPKLYPHSLPANQRRLQEKYSNFVKEGPQSLIHKNFCNKNAARVDDEVKEDMLLFLISDPRNFDNTQVMRMYNTLAEQAGWKKITATTVARYRDMNETDLYARRRGVTAFKNKKTMQVKRSAPTAPLYYLTVDGWDVELLYQKTDTNLKTGYNNTTYHNRVTAVIILDPCCKYPLGYAIGTNESPALIQMALRDAARQTKKLFGKMYRSHQFQSDRYSIKKLAPYYQALGDKFTPAQAHNAKSKIIEPWFNYFNKKYCQMQGNWSGFGITTNRENQPNPDFLNKIRKQFPDFEGVCAQVSKMIEAERRELNDRYLQMWADTPESSKIELSLENYLMHFGNVTERPIMMQASGLHPTINGQKRDYDSFDITFRDHLSVKWYVKYDPLDMSKVLAVSEDESYRYLLEQKYVQPMALKDRNPGDSDELQRIRQFNEQLTEKVANRVSEIEENAKDFIQLLPQLETLNRLMIADSNGQHKDRRNKLPAEGKTTRAQPTNSQLAPDDDDDNIYKLY